MYYTVQLQRCSLFLRRLYESEHMHSLRAAGGDQVHVISAERETVDLYEPEEGTKEREGGMEEITENGERKREGGRRRPREREREQDRERREREGEGEMEREEEGLEVTCVPLYSSSKLSPLGMANTRITVPYNRRSKEAYTCMYTCTYM